MKVDLRTRQAKIAQDFMVRKGYPQARPHAVEKIDEIPCWYFYYRLPDGNLELEVYWEGSEWHAGVTAFSLHDDPDPSEQLAGR